MRASACSLLLVRSTWRVPQPAITPRWPQSSGLLASSLRIGEALGVRWSDLDLDAGLLAVAGKLIRAPIEGDGRTSRTYGGTTHRPWRAQDEELAAPSSCSPRF